jgi:DNA-binding response OmpR family regulator
MPHCDGCEDRDQRIADLEALLGKSDVTFDPQRIMLTRAEGKFLALFLKRSHWTKESAFTVLYAARLEPPEPKIFDTYLCLIRPKLAEHDIAITTGSIGWSMSAEDRIKLQALTINWSEFDPVDDVLPGVAPWR